MSAAAWFCPSCQKYHAPHVETCPAPTGAQPTPAPGIPGIIPYQPPREWFPDPNGTGAPLKPYWTPVVCSAVFPSDPNMIIMNGVANTGGVQ